MASAEAMCSGSTVFSKRISFGISRARVKGESYQSIQVFDALPGFGGKGHLFQGNWGAKPKF